MTEAKPRSRVLAVGALGPLSPSFRVRTLIPAHEIAHHGVELMHHPLFTAEEDARFQGARAAKRLSIILGSRRRLVRRLREDDALDAVLVQRQADMLPVLRLERLAASGRRLILDIDDAIWHDSSRAAGGHPLAALKGSRRKVRWLAERAEAVIAGNELLAEWLQAYSERVSVVPSLVDPERIPIRRHEQADRVLLGWIGSRSTAPSLAVLREPLERLARSSRGRRFELLAVGGEAPNVQGMDCRSEPWSEPREQRFLAEIDIGLMPLPDTPWSRGKCAYKALQYMAAGIPVVADDVGVSAAVIGHGAAGLVAGRDGGWADHLAELAGNAELRARLGAAGRRRVEEGFSVKRWAPMLAGILRGDSAGAGRDVRIAPA